MIATETRTARESAIALCIYSPSAKKSSNAIIDAQADIKVSQTAGSILATLYFLSMTKKLAGNRIAERKLRDRQARRAQIISAARRIAELEGWPNVTVRRLSDEISYSQPVLYAHFGSREGILAAVAIEGFQELGVVLEKARKRVKRGSAVESVAVAY